MRLLLFAVVLAVPASAVLVEDPIGDVSGGAGASPCRDVVDIVAAEVTWDAAGIHFDYEFADMSALADNDQDYAGRCFYSYGQFNGTWGGEPIADSVYVDYSGNPLYDSGWRFYLHERRDDLNGTVDLANNAISVLIPNAIIEPVAGDAIGYLQLQTTSSLVNLGFDYEGDFAPDGEPCVCQVGYPAPKEDSLASVERGQDGEDAPGWGLLIVASLLLAMARRFG